MNPTSLYGALTRIPTKPLQFTPSPLLVKDRFTVITPVSRHPREGGGMDSHLKCNCLFQNTSAGVFEFRQVLSAEGGCDLPVLPLSWRRVTIPRSGSRPDVTYKGSVLPGVGTTGTLGVVAPDDPSVQFQCICIRIRENQRFEGKRP